MIESAATAGTGDRAAPADIRTPRLRAARFATFTFFGLNGFVLGMWAVHIPVVARRTELSHERLGGLLLLLVLGALGGMWLCGRLADRLGARTVVTLSALLLGISIAGPALATDQAALAAALVVFGFANGALDVSMNTHAVAVERHYPRPIMAAFHAAFSVGGAIAAVVAAQALRTGLGIQATLVTVAGATILVTALARLGLLRRPVTRPSTDAGHPVEAGPRRRAGRSHRNQIYSLGLLSFLLLLSEGVAYDWSAVHLRDVLNAAPATAALGYGAFTAAMTLGRLCTDRVAARLGPIFVLRYGAALAAAGITTVALTPWLPLAIAGWTLFGAGLSGCIPQLFTLAGNADPAAAGANLSRVAGTGYLGLLAGPALIGLLSAVAPLNLAFLLPAACCAFAAGYAGRAALPAADRYRHQPGCPSRAPAPLKRRS